MTGRTAEDILIERKNIETILNQVNLGLAEHNISLSILDSFDEDAFINGSAPLFELGRCIQKMSEANMVVFAPGWENSRGCRVEHQCAAEYGLSMVMLTSTNPEPM